MVVAAQLVGQIQIQGGAAAAAELGAFGKTVDSTSGALKGLAVGAVVVAGAALVGLGVQSVKMAGDFQTNMNKLVTSAGEFPKNMKMVSDGIIQLSVATGTSTAQLAAGMYYVESSGQRGAAALTVLGAAARGAKSENADLDTVTKALTTTMTDYHMPVSQSADAMNGLIATVKNGKTNLQELAASMGAVLPTASALHISFPQVAGALDTMTNAGMPAEQAAQNLAHVLVALEAPSKVAVKSMVGVGLSADQVKNALVNQGLPQALQLIEDHVGKQFPKGSVAYETALKNILGGLVGFKLANQLTGDSLKQTEDNINKVSAAMKGGTGAVDGFALVQTSFNFKLDQAKMAFQALEIAVGTQLLPILSQLLGAITPILTGFSAWASSSHAVSDVTTTLHNNMGVIIPVLTGIGAVIASVLIPAMGTLAVEVVAATWPLLAIGAAVAGATAIFMHFYQTNAPFRDFINAVAKGIQELWGVIQANFLPALTNVGNFMKTTVLPILQQVGGYIVSTFKPVWDQLVTTFRSQLLPVWNDLVKAIQPVLPQLKMFGEALLGGVGVAITLCIAIIGGLIHALASALSGIIMIFGGIVEVISGAIKVVSGIIAVFTDLATGNFKHLGADLGLIMNGIGTMFHGTWEVIKGIFQTVIGAIVGFVAGFVQTIVGIFQTLSDKLVGHSIIPDMVAAIVAAFVTMKNQVITWVMSLMTGAIGIFTNLVSQGTSLFDSLKNGVIARAEAMRDSIGAVMHAFVANMVSPLNSGLAAFSSFVDNVASAVDYVAGKLGAGSPLDANWRIGSIPGYAGGTEGHPGGPMIVGEQGPEMLIAPAGTKVLSAPRTSALLSSGIPGYAGGIGDFFSGIASWFSDQADAILGDVMKAIPSFSLPGALSAIPGGMMNEVKTWITAWLKSKLPSPPVIASGGSAGEGHAVNVPGNLISWIQAAMGLAGAPSNWLDPLETIAMMESGGNPNAINLTDSNAAAGHPSQGIMQTIPGTFAAYMMPGHGNILNPIDNIIAGIRYIMSRYGTVFNVPGIMNLSGGGGYVGYANGTDYAQGGYSWVGERGKELMYIPRGAQITPHEQLGRAAAPLQIIVMPAPVTMDGRVLAGGLMPHIANAIKYSVGTHR